MPRHLGHDQTCVDAVNRHQLTRHRRINYPSGLSVHTSHQQISTTCMVVPPTEHASLS